MTEQKTLYTKHEKIRPRKIKGRFQTLRVIAVCALLGIFHLLPLINWGGRQAVLFDVAHRRFYIFGINIWPQDFILLTFTLLGLALILFFVTSLAGRMWCGYACPQTVYTEVFLAIERFFEGDRSKQLRLAKQPWNSPEKIRKRGLKYFFWFLFALMTGIGFVGYFTPIRQLIVDVFTFNARPAHLFWIFFYGGFMFLQAGIVREQFCKFICPYARFQGAMFDQNTLIIAYDENRGEPRRKLSKAERANKDSLGFCIDCSLCVQVCPTGIDIRDGLQLECIACAACVDACDQVMDQIKAPRGLIRYTSDNSLKHGKTHFIRPKTIGYACVISIAFSIFVYMILNKSQVDLDIIRDRNVLARSLSGNRAENIYTIKIMNKTEKTRTYTLSLEGLEGAEIREDMDITVEPAKVYDNVIHVVAPKANLPKTSNKIYFVVTAEDDPSVTTKKNNIFLKPFR